MILLLLACASSDPVIPDTDAHQETGQEDTGEPDPVKELDPADFPAATDSCREPELFWVKDVVDGDTIRVEGKWGGETVRLIGINAPEMDWETQNHSCWAPEATEALQSLLFEQWVWLLFDEECEDDFGRTLAYAHRGSTIEDFVQRKLLRDGHAQAYKVQPNSHFHAIFSADESYASKEKNGQWDACH